MTPVATRVGSRREGRGYRPALDGIRAVAVVAVIAFHATTSLPGGYLGVDVFFVLSGYLITGLLLDERATTGRIRFPGFWARRARRLLPAALVLLAACAVVTARTDSVLTFAARRADMLSTLLYYANWHFIVSGQSYFAAYSGISPLRHTWSLAIEEQFYLLWPVLLLAVVALVRELRRLPWVIISGAVASAIAMALLYQATDPARAYYGTDTRSHELLIGAALAALVRVRPQMLDGRRARRAASWVAPGATAAVIVAFIGIGDRDAFYYRGGSLLFAIAVAAVIWAVEARPKLLVASALSIPVARWVGRISYGLYLWHWPLIVWIEDSRRYARWTTTQRVILEVGLTFLIAAVSFYVVERPIRFGQVPWLRTSGTRLALVASIGMLAVAALVVRSTTISSASIAKQISDTSDSECPTGSRAVGPFSWCSRTEPAAHDSTVVAVIGDSTSRALDPGMRRTATQHGWRYVQAGQNGCSFTGLLLPTNTPYPAVRRHQDECPKYISALLSDVMATSRPDVWIISDMVATRNPLVLSDGTTLELGNPRRDQILVSTMRAALRRLTSHGAKVVFLMPVPRAAPVDCAVHKPAASCSDSTYSRADPETMAYQRVVGRGVKRLPGVATVSLADILCPRHGRCPPLIAGILARYDGVHFTSAFSREVVPVIISRAERAGVTFGGARK